MNYPVRLVVPLGLVCAATVACQTDATVSPEPPRPATVAISPASLQIKAAVEVPAELDEKATFVAQAVRVGLQLALALLLDHTGDDDTATRHYEAFEREVVSQLSCGGNWSLIPEQVTWWLLQQGEEKRYARQWGTDGWGIAVPLNSISCIPVALSFPARR